MTKNKRNLIILGSVLTAVYFAILALGIHNGDKKPSSLDEVKDYQWPVLINKLLSPFAPAVNLTKIECNGQPVQEPFVLNAQQPSCEMDLTPGLKGDKDFWKTKVQLSSVTEQEPEVFVKVRLTDEALRKSPPGRKCKAERPNFPFWLEVEFIPAKQDSSIVQECWQPPDEENQIPLTIMKDGSKANTLKLRCVGCIEENRQEIRLKMK